MFFPNALNGHLYQTITILGAFILIVCCYSLAVTFESHDVKLLRAADHLLDESEDKTTKEFWTSYLEARKRDTETVAFALLFGGTIGLAMMVFGAVMWYRRVQRFEDAKRRLENEKLELEVEASSGRKTIKIAS